MVIRDSWRGWAVGVMAALVLGSLAACTAAPPKSGPSIDDLFASKDQQRAVADCMREKGWQVEFDERTGAIITQVTDAQNSVYEADTAECDAAAGIDFSQPPNDEELTLIYDWYSRIATCLEGGGWEVPPRPSFETFADTYETDPWIPWIEIPGPESADSRKHCPELARPQS